MALKILLFLVGMIIGYWFGWGRAHLTVAQECEKLGKFFVIDKIYHCTLIENSKADKDRGGDP